MSKTLETVDDILEYYGKGDCDVCTRKYRKRLRQ